MGIDPTDIGNWLTAIGDIQPAVAGAQVVEKVLVDIFKDVVKAHNTPQRKIVDAIEAGKEIDAEEVFDENPALKVEPYIMTAGIEGFAKAVHDNKPDRQKEIMSTIVSFMAANLTDPSRFGYKLPSVDASLFKIDNELNTNAAAHDPLNTIFNAYKAKLVEAENAPAPKAVPVVWHPPHRGGPVLLEA